MPNNFRKTPDVSGFYISKDGNDGTAVAFTGANEAVAKDNPRASLPPSANGIKHIVGAGHYQLSSGVEPGLYDSDGKVLYEGDGTIPFGAGIGNDVNQHIIILKSVIKNFLRLTINNYRSQIRFVDCEIIDTPSDITFGANGNTTLENSLIYTDLASPYTFRILASNAAQVGLFDRVINNNTFYNVNVLHQLSGDSAKDNCNANAFVRDDGGVCYEATGNNTGISRILNCGFKGQITLFGTNYSGFSDPQLAIDFPDFVNNQGNFEVTQNLTDCFNNIARRDFTLKITSQLIRQDITVGGREFRFSQFVDIDAALSAPNLTESPNGSSSGVQFREVVPGVNQTTLTSAPFLIDQINGEVGIVNIVNLVNELNFDTDLLPDQPKNKNVPTVENFTTGTVGGNPKRLTFELRTSRNLNTDEPDVDADWDNSFNTAAGAWIKHEFNDEKFVTDDIGRGKGEANFSNLLGEREFVAVWMQIRITLRRDHDL